MKTGDETSPRPAGWRALAIHLRQLPKALLLGAVKTYRFWFQPWLGNVCRYEPSCSQFALDALHRHGAVVGASLACYRLLRCNPWCSGGCDPVPEHPPGLFTRLGLVRPPASPDA